MTAIQSTASPIVDTDWRRASRMAHAFGAAAAGGFGLLLVLAIQFRAHPAPFDVLVIGSVLAVASGLGADLMARPARVRLDGGWLAVSRLGHARRVRIDRLVGLSPNPHAAGSVILVDEAGNQAEIDVRCLVRNPLIWQDLDRAVRHARRSGALELAEPESAFWRGVAGQVARADRRLLTVLDFEPPA
jgi:hypothetical protein